MERIMIRLLSRDEYLSTFAEPMRLIGPSDDFEPVNLVSYVDQCICNLQAAVGREQLEIQAVHLNGRGTYYHVLINYGLHNVFLVIVVDCERKAVHGHYCLDLNEEYGLTKVTGE